MKHEQHKLMKINKWNHAIRLNSAESFRHFESSKPAVSNVFTISYHLGTRTVIAYIFFQNNCLIES